MLTSGSNYFKYFLPSPEQQLLGLCVTTTGFTHVPAGSPYPFSQHPADHHFAWERGRVLEAVQIVLIEAGRGTFEIQGGGTHDIEAGTAFVILPGRWHRYRPDPAVGWDESWIEFQGPMVDGFLHNGLFSLDNTVRSDAFHGGLDEALNEVHALVRAGANGSDPRLAARAYAVVASWAIMGAAQAAPPRLTRAVQQAERYMTEHFNEPLSVERLACTLGLAYSHFRRAFREQTGYAPWQYIMRLRLTRARRQLVTDTDATLEEIALRLGFSSGFHFSSSFKQAFGISPDSWRRNMRELVDTAASQQADAPKRRGKRKVARRTGRIFDAQHGRH